MYVCVYYENHNQIAHILLFIWLSILIFDLHFNFIYFAVFFLFLSSKFQLFQSIWPNTDGFTICNASIRTAVLLFVFRNYILHVNVKCKTIEALYELKDRAAELNLVFR